MTTILEKIMENSIHTIHNEIIENNSEMSITDILMQNIKKRDPFEDILQDTLNNAKRAGHNISFKNETYEYKAPKEPFEVSRSQKQEEGIKELINWITERNTTIQYSKFNSEEEKIKELLNLKLPGKEEFKFKKEAETYLNVTHISFDIETQEQQRLSSLASYNYEAQRLVISAFNEKNTQSEIIKIIKYMNHEIIFTNVQNPLTCLMLGNIEAIITATCYSILMQGGNDLITPIQHLLSNIYIKINTELLEEMIKLKRTSLFFGHNNKFDVHQLIRFNQDQNLDFFNVNKREFTTINYGNNEDIHEIYKFALGNTTAGFRIKIGHSFQNNKFAGKSTISIFPAQSGSFSFSYATDTMLIASTIQRKSISLKKLSEGLKYEKFNFEDNKIFHYTEFQKYTKASHYLIYDVLSTMNVYADLSKAFVFDIFAKVFNIEYNKHEKPFVARITSTASIAKENLIANLMKDTKLDEDQIYSNIKSQSRALKFFEKLTEKEIKYDKEAQQWIFKNQTNVHILQGGITENKYYYLFDSQKENNVIQVWDFKNQYPHVARVVNAYQQFKLASQGKLTEKLIFGRNKGKKYLKQNLREFRNNFINTLQIFEDSINNQTPIPDKAFKYLIGVAQIKTNTEIHYREKPIKNISEIDRNQDIHVKGTIDIGLPDLTYAILDLAHRKNITVIEAYNLLTITEVNYLLFDEIPKFGEELFTKYVQTRDTYPKSNPMNSMLKISGNASYGLSIEGSRTENYRGKFFVSSIGSMITGVARLMTNLASLVMEWHEAGSGVYGDTDSTFNMGTIENLQIAQKIFTNVDPLIYEHKKGTVNRAIFFGRKQYGLLGQNEGKEVFTLKTHGAGAYGRRIKDVYAHITYDILKNKKDPITAIEEHKYLFPLSYQVGLKEREINWYKNWFENSETVNTFNINTTTFKVMKYKNKLIITNNSQDLILSQFFNYTKLNLRLKNKRLFKKSEYTKALKENEFINQIKEFAQIGFDWESFDTTEKKNFVRIWNKTLKHKTIHKNIKETNIDNYISDNFLTLINQDKYYENLSIIATYEEYQRIQNKNQKLNKNYELILQNYSMYENLDVLKEYIKICKNSAIKERITQILDNYEYANKHLYHRFLPINPNNTKAILKKYKRIKDWNSNRLLIKSGYVRNHPSLPITVDRSEYETDGFNPTLFKKLPNLSHSAYLIANQNKLYSESIINIFSLNASINYARTHPDKKIDESKYFDMKKESLPCPKRKQFSIIRLRMKKIPSIQKNKIKIEDINFNHVKINYTIDKQKQTGSLLEYLIDKRIVKRNSSKTNVTLLDEEKYNDTIEKYIRINEFTSIDFLQDLWSIEIVSDQSLNYNATLKVKIVVGRNRQFFAELHINPASHKMINFTPYRLNRHKIESDIIKKLLIKFAKRTDYIQSFDRKQKLFNDNLENIDLIKIANLTLTHVILKNSIEKGNTSLNQFHITTDITCKNPKLALTIYEYLVTNFMDEIYQKQEEKKEMELRNAYKTVKTTTGMAIVNFQRSNASIVYAKNYTQLAKKIQRVSNKNNVNVTELKELRKRFKANDNKIRIETQLKSPSAIEDQFNYLKHDTLVSIIKQISETVDKEIINDNKITEVQNLTRSLIKIDKFYQKAFNELRSLITEEIKLLRQYKQLSIPVMQLSGPP